MDNYLGTEPAVCFDGTKALPVHGAVIIPQSISADEMPRLPPPHSSDAPTAPFPTQTYTYSGAEQAQNAQNWVPTTLPATEPVKLEQGDDTHNGASLLDQKQGMLPVSQPPPLALDKVVKEGPGHVNGVVQFDDMDLVDEDTDGEEDADGEYDPDAL
jgi:hypothetical protein